MILREAYLARPLGKMVCAMLRSGTVSWRSWNAGSLAESATRLSPGKGLSQTQNAGNGCGHDFKIAYLAKQQD